MKSVELRIDVSAAVSLPGRHELATTVYLPDPFKLGKTPVIMFAVPGGGYSRRYFDMQFPGHLGYSQVEHHLELGIVVVTMDPLGVGDSSLSDLAAITLEMLGASYDTAVRTIMASLRSGTLVSGYPALRDPYVVGIGQSMGGCVTILAQGAHRTFDAIAPLGYSAIHTMLPQRSAAAHEKAKAAFQGGREVDTRSLSIEYTTSQISDFQFPFHWEDVPRDILDADMAGGYPLRRTVSTFGSGTIPNCAVMMMSPGIVAKEAAAIDVPVFVGCGERDVCPDPQAEPSAFRSSRDITLMIVPRMAHMHNFAGTRALLWERLAAWATLLAL